MKAKKILVPLDFSDCSEAALGFATSLARDTGATLLLVHVDDTPLLLEGDEYLGAPPWVTEKEARARLDAVILPDPNTPCERYLENGNPWIQIIQLAKDQQVDFIVMGTHGRRGLSRMLLGSIAEAVMRRAPCPVITVKHSVAAQQTAPETSEAIV
jgi:nucleotide-binding universal stress UspA family protein